MKPEVKSGHFHAVRFYEDDKSLCRIVSGFIAEGLALDQPALVIATQRASRRHRRQPDCRRDHRRQTASGRRAICCCSTRARRWLRSWSNGQPDPDFFMASAASVLAQTRARPRKDDPRVRRDGGRPLEGRHDRRRRSSSRCCGTASRTRTISRCCAATRWATSTRTRPIDDVCRHHTHVVSDDGQRRARFVTTRPAEGVDDLAYSEPVRPEHAEHRSRLGRIVQHVHAIAVAARRDADDDVTVIGFELIGTGADARLRRRAQQRREDVVRSGIEPRRHHPLQRVLRRMRRRPRRQNHHRRAQRGEKASRSPDRSSRGG